MRAIIVAHGDNLTLALREAQDVSNILQAGGYSVYLITGESATSECLMDSISHGPFDLAWMIAHSGAEGFKLADQVLSPAQLGLWLDSAHCWEAVLNSCFSAEHVQAIQQVAHVDIVATIDANGVDGRTARSTGVYLAHGLAETGDLRDACQRASGNGVEQYRWFPAMTGPRQARGVAEQDLAKQVTDLVSCLTGGLSGSPGLISKIDHLADRFEQYMAADREWKATMSARLERVEAGRRWNSVGLFVLGVMVAAALLLSGTG